MPRRPTLHSKSLPYHVTARSYDKEWFGLPLPDLWKLSQESLKEVRRIHHVEIIAFVLMNNHYHLLILAPEGNLNLFIPEFHLSLSLKIKNQIGNYNQVFDERYQWSLISSQKYFINCYKYIYQNPVRANLVQYCEDYPFSTLRSLIKNISFSVPVHDRYGFKDEFGLRWLNQKVDSSDVKALKETLMVTKNNTNSLEKRKDNMNVLLRGVMI